MKIIKVKHDTRTFFLIKLCKINYKKLRPYVVHSTGTRYRDNTVLVSSKDISVPIGIDNLEYNVLEFRGLGAGLRGAGRGLLRGASRAQGHPQ